MSNSIELVKNTGVLFLGKISTQFVSFVLLPLYTAKLTTQEYGTLDLYTTIGSILIPILSLQLEQAIFRFLLTSEDDEKKILSSVTMFLLLSSIVLAVSFVPLSLALSIEATVQVFFYYITLLFATVFQQVPRGYGNYKVYTFAAFLSSTISIVFSVVFICKFDKGIEGILAARSISTLFVSAFIFVRLRLYHMVRFKHCSLKCLKSMLVYSVPLVFNQLASSIVNYSDRFIIALFLGVASNGVYAIATKFFSLITTTLNIYNLAWTESVTKTLYDENKNAYYNKIFSFTTAIFFLVGSWVIAGLGILFKYMIHVNFNEAYYQIPILVYAAIFSGLSANVGSIYIAYKMTKEISHTTILTAVINGVVHLVLIKKFALYAASISSLVSFIAMFVFRIYRIRNIEKLKFNSKAILLHIPTVIIVLVTYYLRNLILQIIALLLLCMYTVYLFFSQDFFLKQMAVILYKFHNKKKP